MTTTFKSRWGYHPCDYALYLKLKRLAKGYWQARRLVAAHRRWIRKRPHNRRGPEPIVPAVLRELYKHPVVVREYDQARRPQPSPEQVVPIGLQTEQIDRWFAALSALDAR
jgi:hypothetical protein